MELLPERVRDKFSLAQIVDVVLDLNRSLVVHERYDDGSLRKRTIAVDPFTLEELRSICEDDRLGVWTSDDRSDIHGTLHALPSRRLRSSWKMAVVST